MSNTTTFSPALLTSGQKLFLSTSVIPPSTWTGAPSITVVATEESPPPVCSALVRIPLLCLLVDSPARDSAATCCNDPCKSPLVTP
ncbi:hypothetical protein Mapa_010366 [Marchantia paleacea]|nr:hypothetical protein Mapa_010366 [Marchantia paleacea]